jgi:hypothetical protein
MMLHKELYNYPCLSATWAAIPGDGVEVAGAGTRVPGTEERILEGGVRAVLFSGE